MSQWITNIGQYLNQSGKGVQGTEQIRKTENKNGKNVENASSEGYFGFEDNLSGVDVSITEGAKRVSQWLLAEETLYQGQMGYGVQKEIRNPQDAVSQKAELSQEELEALAEEENKKKQEGSGATGVNSGELLFMERLLESMKESREANRNNSTKQKRALNYNYRKVSGAIMRAKSVNQAGNALTSAKSSLSNLRRKNGSGNYDSNELAIAISHAQKMVRTARKKLQNMKQEERMNRNDTQLENNKEREHNSLNRVERGGNTAKEVKREQELLLLKKQLKQHRKQRENAHRRDEAHELLNADMEYLKKTIELLRQERAMDKLAVSETVALQTAIRNNTGAITSSAGSSGETGNSGTAGSSAVSTGSSGNSSSTSGDAASASTGFSTMA